MDLGTQLSQLDIFPLYISLDVGRHGMQASLDVAQHAVQQVQAFKDNIASLQKDIRMAKDALELSQVWLCLLNASVWTQHIYIMH